MTEKGDVLESRRHVPFHERHRHLIIACSLAGLQIRAAERIFTAPWKNRLLRYWSILIHLIIGSVFVNSLLHLLFAEKTGVIEVVHDILIMGTGTHGTLRQFYMHKNIDKYDDLYTAWDDLFGNDDDWQSRQKSVDKYYKDAKKAIAIAGLGTTMMLTIYSIANFFAEDKIFRFPSILPYRQQSPDYEILVSYYTFEIFWFTLSVASSQMLLVTTITWELGELRRLQKSLAEIFKDCETTIERFTTRNGQNVIGKSFTNHGIATVDLKMKVWVEQHQKLCKFHKMSMRLNNFELGMEMVATFIEACGMAILCSSDHFQNSKVHLIAVISGFSGYFALFYYSCAKCNELSDMSMTVADDAFPENWSSLPLKLKKNFLMIIARTMKPLNYYGAYVFRLDIATFNQIFETAYSVFNFYFTVVNGP